MYHSNLKSAERLSLQNQSPCHPNDKPLQTACDANSRNLRKAGHSNLRPRRVLVSLTLELWLLSVIPILGPCRVPVVLVLDHYRMLVSPNQENYRANCLQNRCPFKSRSVSLDFLTYCHSKQKAAFPVLHGVLVKLISKFCSMSFTPTPRVWQPPVTPGPWRFHCKYLPRSLQFLLFWTQIPENVFF